MPLFIKVFNVLHNDPRAHLHDGAVAANHFVHHGVGFGEVEDQVQFADVAEVAVEGFDEAVEDLEGEQLVGVRVDAGYEI